MLIDPSTLESIISDRAAFTKFFAQYADEVFRNARLTPRLSAARLVDVHGAWCADLKRVGDHEPLLSEGLDHFKRAGHLAFWIRRFSPLVDAFDNMNNLGDAEGYDLDNNEKKFRDFLFAYANEYLAFDLAYQFCYYYETNGEKSAGVRLNVDYLGVVCHFMKYKSVSPHAITVILKSLFFYRESMAVSALA